MASEINFDSPFISNFPMGDQNRSCIQPDVPYMEKDVKSSHLNGFSQFFKLSSSTQPFVELETSTFAEFNHTEPSCESFYRPAPPCSSSELFFVNLNPDIVNKIPLMNNDEFLDKFFNDGISSQFQSQLIDDVKSVEYIGGESFAMSTKKHRESPKRLERTHQEKTVNKQIIKGKWSIGEDR